MKTTLQRILCLLAALLLPLCACAEPLRWLDPLIQINEGSQLHAQGTASIHMDPKAWESLMDYSVNMTEPITLDGYTDEEAAAYQKQLEASIQSSLQLMDNYIGALSALLNETTITIKTSRNHTENVILVGNAPLMTFTLHQDDQGNPLLLSDLFPSYALALSQDEAKKASGDSSPLSPEEVIGKILAAAPRFADFHILNALTQANRMELEALLEKGHAVKEGDTIRYTGTDQELEELISQFDLPYDPLYLEFQEKFPQLVQALSGGEATENEEEEPANALIYEVTGDTFYEQLRSEPYEITSSDTHLSIENSSVLQTHETKTVEDLIEIRYSPRFMEYVFSQGGVVQQKAYVDASEENAIRLDILAHLPQGDMTIAIIWTRHEEGMNISYLQEQPDLPSLRLQFSFSNDLLSQISLEMGMKMEEEWLSLISLSFQGEALAQAPQMLSLTDQKIIVPDPFYGTYEDEGYKAELRKVAVPKLNMWALTRLPKDARPLLTPLLSIISTLGQ